MEWEDGMSSERNKSIPIYGKTGEKRTVWEVLYDVRKEFEKPIKSYAIEISEEEVKEMDFSKGELTELEEKTLWRIERDGDSVRICPINKDSIVIHGADEMWFFICCLLD